MWQILGVDSEFCNVESLVCGVVDNWPQKLRKHRKLFTFCCVMFMFCLDIPMVTQVICRDQRLASCHLCHQWLTVQRCNAGRHLHLPTDGLLLCQWHVHALLGLLSDHIGVVDIRDRPILRLYGTDVRYQT